MGASQDASRGQPETRLPPLSQLSDIFVGRQAKHNKLVIKTLALANGPLTKRQIYREATTSNPTSEIDESTVSRRVESLCNGDKPVLRVTGRTVTQPRRKSRLLYDLTLRGGILALILLTDGDMYELRQYSRRLGWGLDGDETLRALRRLAESTDLEPILSRLLLYSKSEFRRGLLSLGREGANNLAIAFALRKNVHIVVDGLGATEAGRQMIVRANEWLGQGECQRLEHIPWPPQG